MKMKKYLGFTLIELLIVIAIIGILAVAFLPSLLGAPAKGRDAQRQATIQKIEGFLVTEVLANKTLPVTGCIHSGSVADGIGKLLTDRVADFGGKFPTDPQEAAAAPNDLPCAGAYGYVNFTHANAKYTAGVFATMEIVDNANIKCASINSAADPTLLDTVTLGANETGCYLALIQ